jgi:hypothetical protein
MMIFGSSMIQAGYLRWKQAAAFKKAAQKFYYAGPWAFAPTTPGRSGMAKRESAPTCS